MKLLREDNEDNNKNNNRSKEGVTLIDHRRLIVPLIRCIVTLLSDYGVRPSKMGFDKKRYYTQHTGRTIILRISK